MRTLERRIVKLEKALNVKEDLPYILIAPDSTFGEVKGDFEERSGKRLTDEEFRQLLPDIPKIIYELVTRDATRHCEWYEEACNSDIRSLYCE